MNDFAKEMFFVVKAHGNKCSWDGKFVKMLKSPGLMLSASGILNTIFLPFNRSEVCDRLNLLLQGKQAGNNSNVINDEITAVVDKILEYICVSKKQHKQNLIWKKSITQKILQH